GTGLAARHPAGNPRRRARRRPPLPHEPVPPLLIKTVAGTSRRVQRRNGWIIRTPETPLNFRAARRRSSPPLKPPIINLQTPANIKQSRNQPRGVVAEKSNT